MKTPAKNKEDFNGFFSSGRSHADFTAELRMFLKDSNREIESCDL